MRGDHLIHTEASKVNPERGVVIIDGPGNIAISMTVEAAEETARRLLIAAEKARANSVLLDTSPHPERHN